MDFQGNRDHLATLATDRIATILAERDQDRLADQLPAGLVEHQLARRTAACVGALLIRAGRRLGGETLLSQTKLGL